MWNNSSLSNTCAPCPLSRIEDFGRIFTWSSPTTWVDNIWKSDIKMDKNQPIKFSPGLGSVLGSCCGGGAPGEGSIFFQNKNEKWESENYVQLVNEISGES